LLAIDKFSWFELRQKGWRQQRFPSLIAVSTDSQSFAKKPFQNSAFSVGATWQVALTTRNFEISSTFVGYMGGGAVGAVALTIGIFLPAFLFTFLIFKPMLRVRNPTT
jgi:hypothetical protein